jgi:hypothetical protein
MPPKPLPSIWIREFQLFLCAILYFLSPDVSQANELSQSKACFLGPFSSACSRGPLDTPDDYVRVGQAGFKELGLRLETYNKTYFQGRRRADRGFCSNGICRTENCDGDEMQIALARYEVLKRSMDDHKGALCREDVIRFNRHLLEYVGMESAELVAFRDYLTPVGQRELEQSGRKLMVWTEGILGSWLLAEARDASDYHGDDLRRSRTVPQRKWEMNRGILSVSSDSAEQKSQAPNPFKAQWGSADTKGAPILEGAGKPGKVGR